MSTLIPRRILFGNPERAFALISPDGKRIGFLAPADGAMNVYVGPIEAPEEARPVTADTRGGIRHFVWAPGGEAILYLQDRDGDEHWHLYIARLDGGVARDLTPLPGVQAQIREVSPRHPGEILVALNDRDRARHDLYRIRIDTGERRLLCDAGGFGRIVTADFVPRLAVRYMADGGSVWFAREGDGWREWLAIPAEDVLTTYPVGFDSDRRVFYCVDSRGRDTAALCALDLDNAGTTEIFSDPRADVCDVLLSPRTGLVQAAAVERERKIWRVLDLSLARDFEYLSGLSGGDFSLSSRTPDDDHWVVGYVTDDGPIRFYHYDRRARHARFLYSNSGALEGLRLARMTPVTIRARDGLPLVCYYTLPSMAGAPYPLVLLVHGGPWARDEWGFSPWHQWLADRGYAALSVNYRGSTGFGKRFLNAGNREWGKAMQLDLLDAVAWVVAQGIADARRIAILGTSYGGYAALMGLAQAPDTFACGIDLMGPSNLVTLLQSIPPQWQAQRELFALRVGDCRTEEGRKLLLERSPATCVDRIDRPLLIAQGGQDPRVPRAESDRIVAALAGRGIPVTYLYFADEGHGLARPANRLALCAVAEAFLARHLGGRAEPYGGDLAGSSLEVLAGAEHVPGLPAVLAAR